MKQGQPSLIVGLDGQPMAAAYEGATRAPRGAGWDAPSDGPNRALQSAGPTLRNRSRAAYRNGCFLRSGISKNVTTEVGRGIQLISTSDDKEYRAAINQIWKRQQYVLDPCGVLSWGGQLAQIVRARRMSGEVFIRRTRTRRKVSGIVPLQLQILESDLCPMELNRTLKDNRRIVQGVEFVGDRRVAYWFYKEHPNDNQAWSNGASLANLIRVSARDVIHHYNPTRPGQVRGEPDATTSLLKGKTFADYDDAELMRKENRAAFTGALYRESHGDEDHEYDPQTGRALYADSQTHETQVEVRAGSMLRMLPGENMTLFDGDSTGSGYADFMRWQSLQIAAGMETPYPVLTGDWAGLSDRTVRAIMDGYQRSIGADQHNLTGFQVCFRVWRWFVEEAVVMGLVKAPGFADNPWRFLAVDIRPDAWRHLHPTQDIQAREKRIANQLSSAEAEAAECGTDIEDNMKRNARAIKRWREICKEEGLDEAPPMSGIFKQETSE
ncbi:MAG: phage portal protein [Aeromonas veronii]